ncbi:SDR family oxidoreductase [Saccharopolyspora griseoalba]|uniref:SDR family oxidoreductase n=1 Tax=Saccharopolyspora griseoalba TaxID=1431848 RepID=A0ABW2LGM3_9PSEU
MSKLTIITGGGRGIGAATALCLARAGHDLVLAYRSRPDAAGEVAERARELGVRCQPVRADVGVESDVESLFAAAGELGVVTGLVNNAGLTAHIADLADTPVPAIRTVLEVNLLGTILCCRRAAQVMSTGRGGAGGAIVNISSSGATLGSPHEYVHYAAAKAGVDALTMGLSKELAAEGVRVNAVAPGLVHSDIHAGAGVPDRATTAASRVPFGRAGEPEEIGPAVEWLLSERASYTSGAVLRVAGGL